MKHLKYDAIIIGGGFFGCKIALELKNHMDKILILEESSDILQRASYANQARVHNGYHYPRSILTALRSRVNFPKFIKEYKDCIDNSFDKYYAVGKLLSKVTANQFKLFCQRINAPIETAPKDIKQLFNHDLIAEVFRTQEYAFDAFKLKNKILNCLEGSNVELELGSKVIKVQDKVDSGIEVLFEFDNDYKNITAKYVFNCTYSGINNILFASKLPIIPLKHELAEMALVEVPESLKDLGITVMCGPFLSLMPFPPRQLHTLSHVRYTPHCYWQDTENNFLSIDKNRNKITRRSNYQYMIRDAQRYIPMLKECSYRDSLWEIKTVLPQSEVDDSRPILFRKDQGIKNLTCVLGAKIDNIYDIPDELIFCREESLS